jgi:hypothetical protein
MSIAALSRFTVPLKDGTTQGMLMPKLSYRFRVSFENFGVSGSTTELTKQVSDAARPHITIENQKIQVYNSTINYAGRPTWGSITLKLRDDVSGNVSKLVGEQNQKQFDYFEQSSAAAAGDYKFTMRIEMLDGGNGTNVGVLETWECYGCYIQDTAWGELKYSTQTPMDITLIIYPDNCIQVGKNAGIGTQGFPRTGGGTMLTNGAQ